MCSQIPATTSTKTPETMPLVLNNSVVEAIIVMLTAHKKNESCDDLNLYTRERRTAFLCYSITCSYINRNKIKSNISQNNANILSFKIV